jgi:hypothetical protein
MSDKRVLIPGDIYKHFKNKLYQIVGVAKHSETKESYVVYQALYGDFGMYIRPYDMFMSEVDRVKYPEVTQKYRFEKVERTMAEAVAEPVVEATLKSVSEPDVVQTVENNEGVNPYLMEFFDMKTSSDKIEYLTSIRNKIDDRLISDIAASLDITVEEGDLDIRYSSLVSCLRTMARFECGRLR